MTTTEIQLKEEVVSTTYRYRVEIFRVFDDDSYPETSYEDEVHMPYNDAPNIMDIDVAQSALNWWTAWQERTVEVDYGERMDERTFLFRLCEDICGYGIVPDGKPEEHRLDAFVTALGYTTEYKILER